MELNEDFKRGAIESIISKIEKGEQRLSFSALSRFMQSPEAFIQYKTQEYKRTPLMIAGAAAHCLALEGEEVFKQSYFNGRAKEGETRERLPPKQEETARKIAAKILRHPEIKALLEDPNTKTEIESTIELEGFKFKRVLDIDSGGLIIDVKTGGKPKNSLSGRSWKYKVLDMNYDVQAALYCAVFPTCSENIAKIEELPEFRWLFATESESLIFYADKSVLISGFNKITRALNDWRRCRALDAWDQGGEFSLSKEERTIYI